MALPYLNRDDLHRYLNNTICTYNGEHMYVTCGDRYTNATNLNVKVWTLPLLNFSSKNFKEIDHRDSQFNDRALPLGYLNWKGNCYYLERMPYRRQHHAIQSSTIMNHPRDDFEQPWFTSQEMLDMLKGNYPSIREAEQLLANGAQAVALHRHIALRRISRTAHFLDYRGDSVATKDGKGYSYFESPKRDLIKKLIERTGVL